MTRCPHCEKIILTEGQQVTLEKVIARPRITSRDLANILKISIHNASTKLQEFYKAGLLEREKQEDSTGGIYFTYTARKTA